MTHREALIGLLASALWGCGSDPGNGTRTLWVDALATTDGTAAGTLLKVVVRDGSSTGIYVTNATVWMNGDQITDWKDTANHAAGGATDGMIAVQVHGDGRCKPGLYHRFRNIGVKELQ